MKGGLTNTVIGVLENIIVQNISQKKRKQKKQMSDYSLGVLVGAFIVFLSHCGANCSQGSLDDARCSKRCFPAQQIICDEHFVQCAGNNKIIKYAR